MYASMVFFIVGIALCSSHLHHSHGPDSEEHYMDGEHNSKYDREAFLGGEEDAEEFTKLSPDEQVKRLKGIINKIDLDEDGFLTADEVSNWIQKSFKHYRDEEAKQQFVEYDRDGNGLVTWEEYNIQMYDRVIDFDENIALDDYEEESFRQEFVIEGALEEHDKDGDGFVSLEEFLGDYRRDPGANEDPEWILVEKDRFENDYDKDGDGKLNPQELLSWVVPNSEGIAQEEATHIIEEIDMDEDNKLSEAEIIENLDLFLTSEATDYGRQLHDEYFYHDEL